MQMPNDDLFSLLYGDLVDMASTPDSLRSYFGALPSDEVLDRLVRGYGLYPGNASSQRGSTSSPTGNGAASSAMRIPVVDSGDTRSAAPTAESDASASTKELRTQIAQLQGRLKDTERQLEASRKRADALSDLLGRQQNEVRKANGIIQKNREENRQLRETANVWSAKLKEEQNKTAELSHQLESQKALIEERDSAIGNYMQQVKDLHDRIDEKDDTYMQLRRQYRTLEGEHNDLLRDLEEETNRYAQQKQEIFDTQLRESLSRWNEACSEGDVSFAGHEHALQVSEMTDAVRSEMVTTTMSFQKDLAELRSALQGLEATRNALRKDLDVWQQGLFSVRYDRLALSLQLLDTEIWRAMEQQLVRAASGDTPSTASSDETRGLVERMKMLSENLHAACEAFGLRFFRAQSGEPFDSIRHQVNSMAVPTGEAHVTACISPGIEFEASNGERSLIRPAIVTVSA